MRRSGFTFHTPPNHKGRTVERSYAADWDNDRILMKIEDRSLPPGSPNREKIFSRPAYKGEDETFQPWRVEPRDGKWNQVG